MINVSGTEISQVKAFLPTTTRGKETQLLQLQ
jgi:hypothetical protein